MLDSRIINKVENAVLTIGTVQKDKRNPLFVEDKPWEPRFDNLYANVIFDQEEKLYKCWYSPFIIDPGSSKIPVHQRNKVEYPEDSMGEREMAICYAVSKDGIEWTKPNLNLVVFNGSKNNNIVWRGPHGAGILKDKRERDPQKRYKMILKQNVLSVTFSRDGLHWSKAYSCKGADAAGDTHNNIFWAPTLNKYIGITRTWGPGHVRQVGWTSSKDFETWTKTKVVLQGTDRNLQVYSLPTFYYAGVYIGLPAIHDQEADRVWTELAWSPNTTEWYRINPGKPFIPNSTTKGDYDWGCVYSAVNPVILQNEIRIYYGGSDGYHFGWRKGAFCLATIRPDGFAGFEPIDKVKSTVIVTNSITCTGRSLALSADVYKNGNITVTLIKNKQGTITTSKPVLHTVSDGKIEWPDNFVFKTINGEKITLRFELKNAKLYSFSLHD